MKKPPKLTVVGSTTTTPPPPRTLGEQGTLLWRSIQSEYGINDSGSIEILVQICLAADRVAMLADEIARDGPMVRTKTGFKSHPALAAEMANRTFIVKSLVKLGVATEPIRDVGRPPTWSA